MCAAAEFILAVYMYSYVCMHVCMYVCISVSLCPSLSDDTFMHINIYTRTTIPSPLPALSNSLSLLLVPFPCATSSPLPCFAYNNRTGPTTFRNVTLMFDMSHSCKVPPFPSSSNFSSFFSLLHMQRLRAFRIYIVISARRYAHRLVCHYYTTSTFA